MFSTHKKRRKMSVCPNCEHILKPEDNFCPSCGQENHDLKIPLGHLIYEFIESIFHFDIKVWETLRVFFTQPGKISKNFNEGKRARYVPPARLYVFISVIFFFLLNYVFDKSLENKLENGLFGEDAVLQADFPSINIANKELLGVYVRSNANLGILMDEEVDEPKAELKKSLIDSLSKTFNRALVNKYIDSTSNIANFIEAKLDNGLWAYLKDSIAMYPEGDKFRIRMLSPTTELQNDSLTGVKWLNNDRFLEDRATVYTRKNKGWERQVAKSAMKLYMGSKFETNKAFKDRLTDLTHKILRYSSLAMFFLMPIVALILKLLYFRNTFYYEHFIFSILHHSFVFIWFTLLIIVWQFYQAPIIWYSFFLAFGIYLLFALKGNYGQSWAKTVAKYLVLGLAYLLLFNAIALVILLAGFI